MKKKRHEHLLADADVKRWHENQSVNKGDVNLRALGRFCKDTKLTPKALVQMSDKEVADTVQDFIQKMLKTIYPKTGKPYSPGYVDSCLTAIKSWLTFNDRPIKRKIKIPFSESTPTLEEERAPTPQELRNVLYDRETDVRTALSAAIIAFSGCRPQVQGDYRGLDGLRVRDFPEMQIKNGKTVEFKKIPTMIRVKEQLSKNHSPYFTFLNAEGCELLKRYLEERISAGETLKPESGIIVKDANADKMIERLRVEQEDKSPFVSTNKLSEEIRGAMRRVGLEFRPYVWRVYFETHLTTAAGRGIVFERYYKFWAGHSGDIDSVYSTRKRTLPEDMLEDMRSQYERASREFLETANAENNISTKEIEQKMMVTSLRTMIQTGLLNFAEQNVRDYIAESLGIEKIDEKTWQDDVKSEFWLRKLKRKLGMEEDDILIFTNGYPQPYTGPLTKADGKAYSSKSADNKAKGMQISILPDDIDSYFEKGYRMLQGGALPNGKVVVEFIGR